MGNMKDLADEFKETSQDDAVLGYMLAFVALMIGAVALVMVGALVWLATTHPAVGIPILILFGVPGWLVWRARMSVR